MIKITYRFFYFLPVIMLIITPPFLRMIDPFTPFIFPDVIRYLGLVLMIFGGSFFIMAHRLIYRRSQWDARQSALPGEPNTLITSDLYQYIRNPILMAIAVILLGYSLTTGSVLQMIWFGFVTLVGVLIVKRIEEPRLLKKFGDEYRRYMDEVPAFIPRLRRK